VDEEELLPRICARLVETVDGELLKALEARPPAADRLSDLDMVRQQMADLEKLIDQAADRYLKAPVELMPMRVAREESEADAAARVFWEGIRDTATSELRQVDGQVEDARHVLVEPAALRSLLVRLGVKVTCHFKATGAPGRSKGASWVLKRAVMTRPGPDGELDTELAVYRYTPQVHPADGVATQAHAVLPETGYHPGNGFVTARGIPCPPTGNGRTGNLGRTSASPPPNCTTSSPAGPASGPPAPSGRA
jgi:hypothetical protein